MSPDQEPELWTSRLAHIIPLFGHRNWIVVSDAAYPAQSNPGIETLCTGTDHTEVLGKVLAAIAAHHHIRANIFVDAELQLLTEMDSPGITAFRGEIAKKLSGTTTQALDHENIIARLDEAGKLFRILILKSTLAIPYTSVFLQLDCGYWSEEAERRLRDVQAKQTTGTIRSR